MSVDLKKSLGPYINDILDILSDGIYISDNKGKTLKVNAMYEKLTGFRPEDMTGRLVTDLKAEGQFDAILNPDIVKTGEPKSCVQITKLNRKVVLNGYPVFDSKGNVALVVTFVRDITLLSQLKDEILSQQELINTLQSSCKKSLPTSSMIIESKEMKDIMELINNIAQTDATVLLLGETGVGKDMFAKKIHERSERCKKPFFKVDCTTIPENLIESELFGYDAGAFSGAKAKGKPGFFEMADQGTLFLDEVGELPLSMQAKLLRVLQDQEIVRIGSTKVKKIDVRIIAATNRDLETASKDGSFRSDLYYRLRVAVLNLPSLRERKGDIMPLADFFLEKFNVKYKKDISFTKDLEKIFLNYNWPGNVREMENLIQSLVVTRNKEIIEVDDLPNNMLNDDSNCSSFLTPSLHQIENKSLNQIMSEIEKDLLKKSLATHNSVANIANFFKVDRSTIFRKLKKYGLIE
ncbi:PAS domain S-box-containing protein [Desulfitispora alkaliphila]|uniref:sigma-54 interaction domain-containing protein n=1 Tax=Desulfitispora alkaliphila TaxID=622674 RepID=UPI003D1B415D